MKNTLARVGFVLFGAMLATGLPASAQAPHGGPNPSSHQQPAPPKKRKAPVELSGANLPQAGNNGASAGNKPIKPVKKTVPLKQ
jgi:hypothetical protein